MAGPRVLELTRPDKVRAAARHAVEHHGVPALDEPIRLADASSS
jgi:hypothetical protein